MTYEENQYLIHYGVTAEGKERYGGMTNYGANSSKGLIRRDAEKTHSATRSFIEWREGRRIKNLSKVNSKYDQKIEKQKQALKDIDSQAKKNPKEAAMIKDLLNEAKRDTQAKIDKLESKKAKKAAKYSSTAKSFLRSAAHKRARVRGTGDRD